MEQKPFTTDLHSFTIATYQSVTRVKQAIKLAMTLKLDADIEIRTEKQLCQACYYFPHIAGAAMTARPCGLCLEPQTYGSTDTKAFCAKCALAHHLCRRCGGDINMDVTRRNYPARPILPKKEDS